MRGSPSSAGRSTRTCARSSSASASRSAAAAGRFSLRGANARRRVPAVLRQLFERARRRAVTPERRAPRVQEGGMERARPARATSDARRDAARRHPRPRREPAPVPARDPHARPHLRHRAGRHRQDLSRRRLRGRGAAARERAPPRARAPGGRGGRAARLPAGRPGAEGRSVPAADVRRALRDARLRPGRAPHRAQRHRGRAARLHARPHAQRVVHHPRRSAEHDGRADEDVPDAHRLRLARGRHRRHHADRPAAHRQFGPAARDRGAGRRGGRRFTFFTAARRRAPSARAADRRGLRARVEADDGGGSHDGSRSSLALPHRARPCARRARRRCAAGRELAAGGRRGELGIRVVGAPRKPRAQPRLRGKDRPTNVLSFPASPGARRAGDRRPRRLRAVVAREAREQGKTLARTGRTWSCTARCTCSAYDHERAARRASAWKAARARCSRARLRGSRMATDAHRNADKGTGLAASRAHGATGRATAPSSLELDPRRPRARGLSSTPTRCR